MREFPLPPTAKPHTIVPDDDGNIWYTGNSNATIGKLDPRTGEITEYQTQARDPHTALFHPNGKFYFTAQGASMLGCLDPDTGELTEIQTEPRPYGMQVASDGMIWVAYNGTNKLGALDPATMEVRYYEVPNEASRIRRLGLTSDGMIWYGNSTQGRIGRLDPKTGEIKEWPSPSGPESHPYALGRRGRCHLVQRVGDEAGRSGSASTRTRNSSRVGPSPPGVGIVRNMWVTEAGRPAHSSVQLESRRFGAHKRLTATGRGHGRV